MAGYKSLKDHVYEYISKKIQNGELLPNQKLNESEICNELGISRTPAREALIQLSSENLIEYIPRKGFIVKEIDTRDKVNRYQVIGSLDALAAALSLEYITDTDILKMEELVEKISISIKYKNYHDYMKYQEDFHDVYLNKCNNTFLMDLLGSIKLSFVRQSYMSEDNDKLFLVLNQVNEEHKQIIACFKNRDKACLEHMIRDVHWNEIHMDMI